METDALLAGMRAAPGLDPSTIYGVAASGAATSDIPDIAQATHAFGETTRRRGYMEAQDQDVQTSIWASLSTNEQKLLRSTGYKPPQLQKKHHGGGNFLTKAFNTVVVAPTKAIEHVAGEALHYAGAPLRQVQHAYRAAALLTDENIQEGRGAMSFHGVFSPSEWAKTWRESEHGERTFSPVQVQRIRKKFGDDTTELAQQLASGVSAEQLIIRIPEEQRADFVHRLQTDEGLQQAVQEMSNAKLSFGRRLVGANMLNHHPTAGRVLSGTVDGFADFFADPVVIGSKFAKSAELARYLIKGSEDVDRLYQTNASVQRAFTDVAETLNSRGAAGVLRRYPSLAPLADRMTTEGVSTPDKVNDFFKGIADVTQLAQGNGISGAESLIGRQLLHTSRTDQQLLNIKEGARRVIDYMAETPGRLADADKVTKADQLAKFVMTPIGRTGKRLTTLIPVGHEFEANSPKALTTIQRLADTFLPRARADELVNDFANAKDIAGKKSVYTGLVDTVIGHAGWEQQDVDRFMGRFKEALDRQVEGKTDVLSGKAYAANGGDLMQLEGIEGSVPVGVYEQQLTQKWAMPSYRTLRANANKVRTMRALNKTVESEFVDRLMEGAWKPLTLLRLGFPVRAGGEEAVGAMMREGLGFVRGRLATSALKAGLKNKTHEDVQTLAEKTAQEAKQAAEHFERGNYDAIVGTSNLKDLELRAAATRKVSDLEKAAERATQEAKRSSPDRVLPWHPASATLDWMMSPLPDPVKQIINTPSDLFSHYVGDQTRRAFRHVQGKLGGDKYVEAARDIFERTPAGENSLLDLISAVENRAGGYLETPKGFMGMIRRGERAAKYRLVPTGEFADYAPHEDEFLSMWQHRMRMIGSSDLGKTALANIDKPREEAVRALADLIESPAFARNREMALRGSYLRDGRHIGDAVGTTGRDAAEDWAQVVLDDVAHYVTDQEGNLIGDIRDQALRAPTKMSFDQLEAIPLESRPALVQGPKVRPVPIGHMQEIINNGFTNIVGRPMDWLARQPMFVHSYAKAKDDFAPLVDHLKSLGVHDEEARNILTQRAMERAVDDVTPYIHDPKMRSQFSVATRNLLPFWFAQEQFYKRWIKTFKYAPESFREAQLVMNGFRHSGFLHQDDQGNDYFMYPAAGAVQNVLSEGFERVTGHKISMPIPVGFSGQVRFASPGLERLGMPSFGPLASVPIHAMANRFPELAETEQALLGDRGAGRAYWEQITPTTIQRIVHLAVDRPDTSQQMTSAMMQSLQYLKATGQTPPDTATPLELERFNRRVRDWTRVLFLTRTLFGFGVPASPDLQIGNTELNDEFRGLLRQLPIDQAMKEFIRLHPDASAYTVFQSKSKSGAPLPATESAAHFMADHADFLRAYPAAGGWFVPQTPTNEEFSQVAYREQLSLELRQRKTFEQFEQDIYHSEAASVYYRNRDAKDAQLEKAKGNSGRQTQIRKSWSQWSGEFLTSHPLFANDYRSPEGVNRRTQALRELQAAFRDPRVPKNDQTKAMSQLLNNYSTFQAVVTHSAGDNTSAAVTQRRNARTSFNSWAKKFIAENPEVEGLYNKVIRPEVET